jgi:hypothetical protein
MGLGLWSTYDVARRHYGVTEGHNDGHEPAYVRQIMIEFKQNVYSSPM